MNLSREEALLELVRERILPPERGITATGGLSTTRHLWAATGLSWDEATGTMERDSIFEGLKTLS